MAYCTIQDMIDRFGNEEILQLSDRQVHLGVLNSTRVQAAIDDACAEIDLELSACYVLPITSSVPILKHWACDVARFHLYDTLVNEDHEAFRRYKDYEEEIKSVCKKNLVDSNGVALKKISAFGVSVAHRDSCLPKNKCCKSSCGCSS